MAQSCPLIHPSIHPGALWVRVLLVSVRSSGFLWVYLETTKSSCEQTAARAPLPRRSPASLCFCRFRQQNQILVSKQKLEISVQKTWYFPHVLTCCLSREQRDSPPMTEKGLHPRFLFLFNSVSGITLFGGVGLHPNRSHRCQCYCSKPQCEKRSPVFTCRASWVELALCAVSGLSAAGMASFHRRCCRAVAV